MSNPRRTSTGFEWADTMAMLETLLPGTTASSLPHWTETMMFMQVSGIVQEMAVLTVGGLSLAKLVMFWFTYCMLVLITE